MRKYISSIRYTLHMINELFECENCHFIVVIIQFIWHIHNECTFSRGKNVGENIYEKINLLFFIVLIDNENMKKSVLYYIQRIIIEVVQNGNIFPTILLSTSRITHHIENFNEFHTKVINVKSILYLYTW